MRLSSTASESPCLARLLALLMVSLTGMDIWDSGRFGLTLGAGVRLCSVIGLKRCRSIKLW
ncbi:hypothetical protein HUN01_32620 [Nostoc edaphicum CCNP1411]|uniref:Uncharacterized protein n=1 Tax=Nostoc edaphicum CCNP1411 TaxID=1472755 RepID=A0A7D7LF87_9NOSO|nr:hypothetical protein [Nostoc edaphicum]QMS92113.1 hypothetical protein HUN01_32620 [Nostoc edaphicum CCNP1411]